MRRRVIFLDIDGTILRHHNDGLSGVLLHPPQLLPGTLEKLNEWEANGYTVILCTGRAESMRRFTEQQLESLGVFYSQLLMGVTGDRILINDRKPDGRCAAYAITPVRNAGIADIEMPDD